MAELVQATRFTPLADKLARHCNMSRWANTGSRRALFDDLVGDGEQRLGNDKSKRLGCLHIDHSTMLSWMLSEQASFSNSGIFRLGCTISHTRASRGGIGVAYAPGRRPPERRPPFGALLIE
jgi:hypothetical protein